MSASKKLKALDAADTPLIASTELFCALPQIVAVVEAAELLRHEANTIHHPEYPSTLKSNYAAAAALAALDEALS